MEFLVHAVTLFGGCRDASPCDEEFRHCEPCVHALNGSDFELLNGHVLVLHAPDVLHVDLFELRCLGEEYAQVTMWVLSEQCRVMIDHECQAFLKHCSGLQTHGSKASYLGKNCILVVKSVVIQGDRPALLLQMTGTSGRRHHNCWSEHDRAQYLHVECVRQRLIELDTDIPAQGIMDSTRHRQVHSPILIGNEVSVGRCRNSGEDPLFYVYLEHEKSVEIVLLVGTYEENIGNIRHSELLQERRHRLH